MNENQQWFADNYGPYWLLNDEPRNSQISILNKIDEALNSGYKNIIVNAGVGIGKSAIANTILNSFPTGYICTKTTNLQNQYINDYPNLIELKGRKHYSCNYKGNTCDNCHIQYLNEYGTFDTKLEVLNEHGRIFERYDNCTDEQWYDIITNLKLWSCSDCEYKLAIKRAQMNPHIVANYHSLYVNSVIMDRFGERDIIIFDECHNLENITMDIIQFTFNPDKFYEDTGIDVFDNSESKLRDMDNWMILLDIKKEHLIEERNRYVSLLNDHDIYFNKTYNPTALRQIINDIDIEIETLDYNLSLVEDGMYVELPYITNRKLYVGKNKITFKPVFGEKYVNNFLNMGEIRLFFTGTLPKPNIYCDWIGLNQDNVKYIYEKSPYPVENRPIVYNPIDNFSGTKNKNGEYKWMKYKNILQIKNLLLKHDCENIVIHTTSNDQTNWLWNNLHNEFDCIVASGNDRDEIINDFKNQDNYNVLISPSIKEGVDFKGDSCTVQIILKLPRPIFAGAIQERVKKYLDSEYMNYFTAINLEQAYGRGVRAEDDKCITYIVDKAFLSWFKGDRYNVPGKEYLSKYFQEAIVMKQ